jgi:hypothetical protein
MGALFFFNRLCRTSAHFWPFAFGEIMGRKKKKDSPSRLLMKYVEAGQCAEIKELLATIDDAPTFLCEKCVDGDGSNAMHRAAAAGKIEVMQVLMRLAPVQPAHRSTLHLLLSVLPFICRC